VTPLRKISTDLWILELFHGPTFGSSPLFHPGSSHTAQIDFLTFALNFFFLAFKDVALQFLGNLFEFFLERKGGKDFLTVVGATSGDTGRFAANHLLQSNY